MILVKNLNNVLRTCFKAAALLKIPILKTVLMLHSVAQGCCQISIVAPLVTATGEGGVFTIGIVQSD